jgi:Na+-transporting methylmalonyl-CoA/oxaloacetate decarboxylase beta subunit
VTFNPKLVPILIGSFGALLQEILFWYEARTKLSAGKYRALLKSVGYWVTTALMVVGAGVGSWMWFEPATQNPKTYLFVGAAFPIIFKKVVAALIPKATHLGAQNQPENISAADYFDLA